MEDKNQSLWVWFGVEAYRLEGGHCIWTRGSVVHSNAAVRGADLVVDHLWHALEGAVAGSEVDVGCPVVGQILVEGARGAGCQLGNVGHGHRGVEAVLPMSVSDSCEDRGCTTYTSDDLVDMGRRNAARLDKTSSTLNVWFWLLVDWTNVRVDAVDGDLRAPKPQHRGAELRLDGSSLQRNEAYPTHGEAIVEAPVMHCRDAKNGRQQATSTVVVVPTRMSRQRSRANPDGLSASLKTPEESARSLPRRLAYLGEKVPVNDGHLVGLRLTTLPRPIRGVKFDGLSIPRILPDGQSRRTTTDGAGAHQGRVIAELG